MKVLIDKSFDEDIAKVDDKKLLQRLADLIEHLENCKTPSEISHLKKLKGASDCYRIRIGDYRIGIRIQKGEIKLIRFLPRKTIYRFFPE